MILFTNEISNYICCLDGIFCIDKMQLITKHVLLALLLTSVVVVQGQNVDCLQFIHSSYASPASCTSTSTDTRPINVTANVKIYKNVTWYGYDDWNPYIARDGRLFYDLYQERNCFVDEPTKGKMIAGKSYFFSVKCTLLNFTLLKGDTVYFDLFEDAHHRAAECSFAIPIPGYSEEVAFKEPVLANLQQQAAKLRQRRQRRSALRARTDSE